MQRTPAGGGGHWLQPRLQPASRNERQRGTGYSHGFSRHHTLNASGALATATATAGLTQRTPAGHWLQPQLQPASRNERQRGTGYSHCYSRRHTLNASGALATATATAGLTQRTPAGHWLQPRLQPASHTECQRGTGYSHGYSRPHATNANGA